MSYISWNHVQSQKSKLLIDFVGLPV